MTMLRRCTIALLAAAEALVPFANDISKLSPAELQPWLARDIGRRKQELVALAWLGRGHRAAPALFDGVFTFQSYADAPWCESSGSVYCTVKTGCAIVPRGVPVSLVLDANSDDVTGATVSAVGCDLSPELPLDAQPLADGAAARLCRRINDDAPTKRIVVDAITKAVFGTLVPALEARPLSFESLGDARAFEPRHDLFAREGSEEKWLQGVSEYYFASARLQEVVPAGAGSPRFTFYLDPSEPLNSQDPTMNVNPEVICCKFGPARDVREGA